MPVWHKATRPWVEAGRLVVIGITQEQHADRCRLFAQWQGFDWPILHDPIDVMEAGAVPLFTAIDEWGVVRDTRPRVETFEREFLNRTFTETASAPTITALHNESNDAVAVADVVDVDRLQRRAVGEDTAAAWRNLADALVLWRGADAATRAIDAYRRARKLAPDDGYTLFRLGVAYRMRYESPARLPGDFQQAVNLWGRALETDPNHYIWRRRIQQYGPRLMKPYPFYDWVLQATTEITARGENPIALTVRPTGAEIAVPTREFTQEQVSPQSPDPLGRIHRDRNGLVRIEVTMVPTRIHLGETARIHVAFFPNPETMPHWNNEAEPLRLWIDPPAGWGIEHRLLAAPQPPQPESTEVRRIDFEVQSPVDGVDGAGLRAYALYYVCEDAGGICHFMRQDIPIDIEVVPR